MIKRYSAVTLLLTFLWLVPVALSASLPVPSATGQTVTLTHIDAISSSFVSSAPSQLWEVTRYYTATPGQKYYYNKFISGTVCNWRTNLQYVAYQKMGGSYEAEVCMNGGSQRFVGQKPMSIAACPPQLAYGTKLKVSGIGIVTCEDRGSAVQGHHIDIWAGAGDTGYNNIHNAPSGELEVTVL